MINEFVIGGNKKEKVELTDIELIENDHGFCLDMTYRVEDEAEIREFHIPCLKLGISRDGFKITTVDDGFYKTYLADVGFGVTRMLPTKVARKDVCYTMKTIETKTKEMTLDEIEKKLGHKVKIVNK